jgi:hypothetical protein
MICVFRKSLRKNGEQGVGKLQLLLISLILYFYFLNSIPIQTKYKIIK